MGDGNGSYGEGMSTAGGQADPTPPIVQGDDDPHPQAASSTDPLQAAPNPLPVPWLGGPSTLDAITAVECPAYYLPLDTPVAEVAAALIRDLYRWGRRFKGHWDIWTTWATGRLCFLALRPPHVFTYLRQHHHRPDNPTLAHFLAATVADDVAQPGTEAVWETTLLPPPPAWEAAWPQEVGQGAAQASPPSGHEVSHTAAAEHPATRPANPTVKAPPATPRHSRT